MRINKVNNHNNGKKLTGIQQVIKQMGSQSALAKLLGVSQQVISQWERQGYVPVGRILEIEAQSGVSRRLLIDPRLSDLLDAGAE
jgi:DNA-binding transcriptional regulator YdaS (Cro superfamily)